VPYGILSLTHTHTAKHGNTPRHTATHCTIGGWVSVGVRWCPLVSVGPNGRMCDLFIHLPHVHANWKTLQRTATQTVGCQSALTDACVAYLFLSHTPTHIATNYNTLQHTTSHCTTGDWGSNGPNKRLRELHVALSHAYTHCNKLQHTATHCNTPQHTVPQAVGGPLALTDACVTYSWQHQGTTSPSPVTFRVWWTHKVGGMCVCVRVCACVCLCVSV